MTRRRHTYFVEGLGPPPARSASLVRRSLGAMAHSVVEVAAALVQLTVMIAVVLAVFGVLYGIVWLIR